MRSWVSTGPGRRTPWRKRRRSTAVSSAGRRGSAPPDGGAGAAQSPGQRGVRQRQLPGPLERHPPGAAGAPGGLRRAGGPEPGAEEIRIPLGGEAERRGRPLPGGAGGLRLRGPGMDAELEGGARRRPSAISSAASPGRSGRSSCCATGTSSPSGRSAAAAAGARARSHPPSFSSGGSCGSTWKRRASRYESH